MSLAGELQAALVAALGAAQGVSGIVSGVFDGPPPRPALPYLTIDLGPGLDWSTKTQAGREQRPTITIWEESGRTLRLRGLLDAVGACVAGLNRDLPSGRIASLVLLRERVARDPAGPWAGLVELRVRMLAD
jgi:hypothetical protein